MKRYKRSLADVNPTVKMDSETRSLYKKAIKQIELTNKRLERLERGADFNKGVYNPKSRRFERKGNLTLLENGKTRKVKTTNYVKYDIGTWASKKLEDRLENYFDTATNRIRKPSQLTSKQELRGIIKATKKFLRSQTSTLKGIKQAEDTTKETIKNILGNDEEKFNRFNDEDVETLYNFWNDDDWNYVTQYIDPSELYILLDKAKSDGWSEDRFLEEIYNYIYSESVNSDADLKDALIRIYHKFVD